MNVALLEYRLNHFFQITVTQAWNIGQGHEPPWGIIGCGLDVQLAKVANVSDEETDDDDDKNDANLPAAKLELGVITSIFEVDPYLSCPTPSCNNTKLLW